MRGSGDYANLVFIGNSSTVPKRDNETIYATMKRPDEMLRSKRPLGLSKLPDWIKGGKRRSRHRRRRRAQSLRGS
jgi:hypothetical protein